MIDVINLSNTECTGLDNEMAEENRNRRVLPVSLSEAQLEAIDTAAKEAGMNRSEYIRHIFMKNITDFPDDLQHVGKYKRTPKN